MSRLLVLTNDFPTRRGGIETFVLSLCHELERARPGSVVVYTASMPGGVEHDAGLPFPVHRDPTSTLLPTPAVARRVGAVVQEQGCDQVVIGSSVPLGLLARGLRRRGVRRVVALTHGHEVWWARTPVARSALRRVGETCDVLTYVSQWCRDAIAPALSETAASRMRLLSPGVDVERFRPGCGGADVRVRLGWPEDAPVVVCTARMVRRKGQDVLVSSWPEVVSRVPGARLLLVGDGPKRGRVERAVRASPVAELIHLAGSVPWSEVPAWTDAGDVFAMPCRTRLGGLEPEAFGIVFLEAAACGLPVVVGRSGGAPETVEDGVTGHVVDPRSVPDVAEALVRLLTDREAAARAGARGRRRVEQGHTWRAVGARLQALLEDDG